MFNCGTSSKFALSTCSEYLFSSGLNLALYLCEQSEQENLRLPRRYRQWLPWLRCQWQTFVGNELVLCLCYHMLLFWLLISLFWKTVVKWSVPERLTRFILVPGLILYRSWLWWDWWEMFHPLCFHNRWSTASVKLGIKIDKYEDWPFTRRIHQ